MLAGNVPALQSYLALVFQPVKASSAAIGLLPGVAMDAMRVVRPQQ